MAERGVSMWAYLRPQRGTLAVVAVAIMLTSTAAARSTIAHAAPAPTPIFVEDFENIVGTTPVPLTSYVGATGMTYTADPAWLTACNGVILSFSSPDSALPASGCTLRTPALNQTAYASVRQMAWALGSFEGVPPTTNRAVTAYTDGADPGPNKVQFATVGSIPLSSTNRFLDISVTVAEENCTVQPNHALLEFFLVSGTTLLPTFTAPVDPCSSPTTITAPAVGTNAAKASRVGTFVGTNPVLFTGSSAGITIVNAQGSGVGNDAAFDNVRLLDVTPQLDKAFSPPNASGVSTLTFTITNTSELGAKNGWSFTDTLPSGVVLATPTAAATTCPAGTVTGTPGGSTVSAAGNLDPGQASCTVTVDVVGTRAGTFTNGPTNMTALGGLNAPGTSDVTFTPSITLAKTAGAVTDANGDGVVNAGDTIAYTFAVTNTGTLGLDVSVTDDKVGAITCPQPSLAPGISETCTTAVPYVLTQADLDAGQVTNTAEAVGTVPAGGAPAVSNPATVTVPLPALPALSITKSASLPAGAGAGDTIQYTFRVTNTGNQTLSAVRVSDQLLGAISCPQATLLPGQAETCTAPPHVITEAEIAQGVIGNVAVALGDPPGTSTSIASSPSSVTILLARQPLLPATGAR